MSLADWVSPALILFQWLCYISLAYYVARILDFSFKWELREAMAMAYTLVAGVFVVLAAQAIPLFVQKIIEAVSVIRVPGGTLPCLALSAGLVCAAFICNCGRSLWMLKSLDHANFEPVSNWKDLLSKNRLGRGLEFLTRIVAALLFIALELELKKIGERNGQSSVAQAAQGLEPPDPLTGAGYRGLWLYLVLVGWWLNGFWIAGKNMPRWLLVFFVAGLVNSCFVYIYASGVVDEDLAFLLVLILLAVSAGALYMVGVVLWDVCSGLWRRIARTGAGSQRSQVPA